LESFCLEYGTSDNELTKLFAMLEIVEQSGKRIILTTPNLKTQNCATGEVTCKTLLVFTF